MFYGKIGRLIICVHYSIFDFTSLFSYLMLLMIVVEVDNMIDMHNINKKQYMSIDEFQKLLFTFNLNQSLQLSYSLVQFLSS